MEYTTFISILVLAIIANMIHPSTQSCQTEDLEYQIEKNGNCYNRHYRRYCEDINVTISFKVTCTKEPINLVQTHADNDKVTELQISEANISNIESSALSRYPNLKYLKIYYSPIEDILPGAFNGLSRLQFLTITDGGISVLPKGVFNSLTTLKHLDLSNNSILTIEEHTFIGLSNLQSLSLSKNGINDITELENVCASLITLDLSYNKITTVIPFTNFTNLRTLNLSNNKIRELSYDTFARTPINTLYLSENVIESIDSNAFAGMTNLQSLNLASNNLWKMQNYEIPVGIFRDNKLLERLNLSRTGLSMIRVGSFTGLEHVSTLDLSFNNLVYLPKGLFHDLKQIQALYIDHNNLTDFQYDGFGALQKINLNNNPWHCDRLSNITKKLLGTEIVRGVSLSNTNVFGISCSDHTANENSKFENSDIIPSTTSERNNETISNAILEEYQNFFEGIRKDLKELYAEFSGKFINTFEAMCTTSIDSANTSKRDEANEVNLNLIQSMLEKINTKERASVEDDTIFNGPQQIKSERPDSQVYYDFTSTNIVLVLILIVLIFILCALVFTIYMLSKLKSIHEFHKNQLPLLDNGTL